MVHHNSIYDKEVLLASCDSFRAAEIQTKRCRPRLTSRVDFKKQISRDTMQHSVRSGVDRNIEQQNKRSDYIHSLL
jgi:hypothetical protein